ncbi:carboxypeptidase-like regulatory domain-containing protein [Pricia sp. S334]|uniref:Carboxypeptidase-like regulatory domain-containing protein n=1 Tax=Pricia mediterranea TaxID=3076079 RepID=A0ABU3L6H4_9FLAO|nr:carboxypeptidase-like regulatory domain-containing protein [Pricia sp. S334]MDT7828687.1 carboxypeptidase-like regulatory domain-containing protein [Pricia sp. S334]
MRYLFSLIIFTLTFGSFAQETPTVSGTIVNARTKVPIVGITVAIETHRTTSTTDGNGQFKIISPSNGDYILSLTASDFVSKRIPISIEGQNLDLGILYLEKDISVEQTDNLISLTESELLDDEINSNSSALLQATRDVFLNRAAFDFGQAFFRVRGYDSENGKVLINGIPMNKFYDGRPQWNNWGGLNDVTRNQQFSNGLTASDYTFGGILGNTNIDTRPSGMRPGTRLSASASNRTYAGRLMATYNSGLQKNGLAYSVSASRRWAKQGYIDGTLYDAYSAFGAVEYRFDEANSLNLTGLWASNRRGRSSAITEEVFELAGKRYNPYWGEQDAKIRNSRERKIAEPILMLNHFYTSDNFNLNTGISYQFGTNARSRLGYYNAPNPDPTYYRYLPSFYINSPIGANFASANSVKERFLNNPQLDWQKTYTANAREKAAYVLYDDVADDTQLTGNALANWTINDRLQADFGLTFKKLTSENYAEIDDLLGADFYEDIDPFSDTRNDVTGEVQKGEAAIFNYNYRMHAAKFDGFAQFRYTHTKWNAFLAGNYTTSNYQREGLFQNERFPDASLGESEKVSFADYGIKSGFTYNLTGRHGITVQGAYLTRPPVLQNVFINPRENNGTVPGIQSETVSTVDLNYHLRLPKLTGRLTGFYTRFQNTTDVNFFFVDTGVGSDFVQEVLTDLDKLHMGTELGLEYQLSSAVKLTGVAAVGKYLYASHPDLTINFDTAGREEDLINLEGRIDLGQAIIKNYRLAQGPQQAYAVGVEYRDPKYWWISTTANYLADNYANISAITRTRSFYLNPETGATFPDATDENVNKLLAQKPLDNFYLLNLVGGKSWLKNGKYISVFASVNNLFDTGFRTGGYEQSRNGNFGQLKEDNLSGTPSFAPKYWYGYGRTYFLNLAYSF